VEVFIVAKSCMVRLTVAYRIPAIARRNRRIDWILVLKVHEQEVICYVWMALLSEGMDCFKTRR
jgi:hypothetical protein